MTIKKEYVEMIFSYHWEQLKESFLTFFTSLTTDINRVCNELVKTKYELNITKENKIIVKFDNPKISFDDVIDKNKLPNRAIVRYCYSDYEHKLLDKVLVRWE